jgi:hypothetical protein
MASCTVENTITKIVIEISSLILFLRPKKVKKIQTLFSHIFKNGKFALTSYHFCF